MQTKCHETGLKTYVPHLTTSSSDFPFLKIKTCKCQLFTDESNQRLPKCLSTYFSSFG